MTVDTLTKSVRGSASEVKQWLITQGFSEVKNLAAKTLKGSYIIAAQDKKVTISRIERSRSIVYSALLESPKPAPVSEVELPELLAKLLAVATSECLVGPKEQIAVPKLFSEEYFEALKSLLMDSGSPTQAYFAWSWLSHASHTKEFDGFPSELVEYLRDVLKGWIVGAAISPRFGTMLKETFVMEFITLLKRGFALEKVLAEKAPVNTVMFIMGKIESIGTLLEIKTTYCTPSDEDAADIGYIHIQSAKSYGCYIPAHVKGVVLNG